MTDTAQTCSTCAHFEARTSLCHVLWAGATPIDKPLITVCMLWREALARTRKEP